MSVKAPKSAVSKGKAEKGELEDSEEEDQYFESGLPPPSPFNRRGSSGEGIGAFPDSRLPRSISVDQLYGMKDRVGDDESRFSPGIDFLRAKGSLLMPTATPESDVFAERKKKLTSRVMTMSMPDMRNVRAMYNQGIGKSMRSRSSQNLDEQGLCTDFDSTFDSLLSDIQDDTGH
jgi:hypothetical protein